MSRIMVDVGKYNELDEKRVDARIQLHLLEERGASTEQIDTARALVKALNARIAALGLHGVN